MSWAHDFDAEADMSAAVLGVGGVEQLDLIHGWFSVSRSGSRLAGSWRNNCKSKPRSQNISRIKLNK